MAYVLRAPNPSKIIGGNVYLTEHGRWSLNKEEAKHFKTKAEADAVKKSEIDAPTPMNKIVSENLSPRKTKEKKEE